jgi:hypothetical protein
MFLRVSTLGLALMLAACAQTSVGDGGGVMTGSTHAANEKAKTELPRCTQPLASVALVERRIAVLDELELTSPLPVINAMISESGCFQIVDEVASDIARSRGRKQKRIVPDYTISADILAQNPNAGSFDTSALSAFLPGISGKVAGSVSVRVSEVKTILFLSDTKTGLQVASVTGEAQTADFGGSVTRFANTKVNIGVYADTPIGKTASAAFLDAYIKLVNRMKASPPKVAAKR